MITGIPSCILSDRLWYNESIQVDKASVHFLEFSENSINHVSQHFSDSRPSKNGTNLRERESTTYMKFSFEIAAINRLCS